LRKIKHGPIYKGRCGSNAVSFSDLTGEKKRPALVVANLKGDDLILCMITGQNARDEYAISLLNEDFATGSLKKESNVRPNRIFTADSGIILYRIGTLESEKLHEVTNKIIDIFS
jgi:mRNA interferase MazF